MLLWVWVQQANSLGLANSQETVVVVPAVVVPVEVGVPPVVVVPEIRNVTVAIEVPPD